MPYAARLNAASGMRATMAATYGPSTDIISQVAAKGSQNQRMDERASRAGSAPNQAVESGGRAGLAIAASRGCEVCGHHDDLLSSWLPHAYLVVVNTVSEALNALLNERSPQTIFSPGILRAL